MDHNITFQKLRQYNAFQRQKFKPSRKKTYISSNSDPAR